MLDTRAFHSPLRLILLLALLVVGLGRQEALWAHEGLLEASPSAGARLTAAPEVLRLRFSGPVNLPLAGVELFGPGGAVELGELRREEGSPRTLVVDIRGSLAPGAYTVRWQVAGADGHPVRGSYSFHLAGAEAGGGPGAVPGVDLPPRELAPPSEERFGVRSLPYVLLRWLSFAALLGVLGAMSFGFWVLGLVREQNVPERWQRVLVAGGRARAARWGLRLGFLLLVLLLFRLLAQSWVLHGAGGIWNGEQLRALLFQTLWGWGWLLSLLALQLVLWGFFLARRREEGKEGRWASRAGWGLAAAGGWALAFATALSGHATAVDARWGVLPILVDALHVLGAGGWMGSLAFVLGIGVPSAFELGEERSGALFALLRAFSPTALFFAALLVGSGVLSAYWQLGSLEALVGSEYGRVLLVKLALFLGVLAMGAYNFLFVLPRLGTERGAGRLRSAAQLELSLALLVLLATAVLVATPPAGP